MDRFLVGLIIGLFAGILIGANNYRMVNAVKEALKGMVFRCKVAVKVCSYIGDMVKKAEAEVRSQTK